MRFERLKSVIMSGGDIGGANILLPMILYFESENIPSMVIDHGYLSRVLSEYRLKNVDMIPPCDETFKNILTSPFYGLITQAVFCRLSTYNP